MKGTRFLIIAIAVLVSGSVHAAQFTPEQQTTLQNLDDKFVQKSAALEAKLDAQISALGTELTREGRLGSGEAAATSVKQANAIVKEIGALAGQSVQLHVEFLLKAKNVLTMEQKLHLLEQLGEEAVPVREEILFLETEIIELPVELTLKQRRKLIEMDAVMQSDEIRAERDAKLILLDLETALLAEPIDPVSVDKLMTKLGDLAAKVINFRVDYFLKAKDVLTLEQKQALTGLLELN